MEHDDQPGGWWNEAVIYQIYPRSFADSDGDGTGDLEGIVGALPYLSDLGVDAIWLSPTQPSPMADFGYDVADYCGIDPVFGTLDGFERLVAATHEAGMRLVMDYVPNHTSDQHPWFTAARSGPEDPKRDWYVWRDPGPDGGPPNNWRAAFSDSPAWTLDDRSGQYYLHLFLSEQPDLNWENPAVREAMADVLRFWMDLGVDGFRADVVHAIGKGQDLPDASEDLAGLPACIFDQGPGTHDAIRLLRRVVDGDEPGVHLLLGETAVFDRGQQLSYLGRGDELHLGFNFLALHTAWEADRWRAELDAAYEGHDAIGAWPTWVLSNHDVPRHRSRYGSDARARAAAVLLLTLRGTPFLYQGEELGLSDAVVPPDRVLDPGGRDGCRAPVPWTRDETGGWGPQSWLPPPPNAAELSVAAQSGDGSSMLEHYRSLLELRRRCDVLRRGTIELLDSPTGTLRYRRSIGGAVNGPTDVEVAINFTDGPVDNAVSPGRTLATSIGESAGPATTTLGADEARVVEVDGLRSGA